MHSSSEPLEAPSLVSNEPVKTPSYADRLREFARYYAQKGLRVFPLYTITPDGCCSCGKPDCSSPGKHPQTPHGVKDATTSLEHIDVWWNSMYEPNIGIATGNGLLVVDIDPRHGGSLEALHALVELPTTAIAQTGGGGWHVYLTHQRDVKLRNSTGKLGPGIDTRSEGGYVVAPPSRHSSGQRYRWHGRTPLALTPQALLDLLYNEKSLPPQHTIPSPSTTSIAPSLTSPLIAPFLKGSILEGERNSSLYAIGHAFLRNGATQANLLEMLRVINLTQCQPPLHDAEIHQIVQSIFNSTRVTAEHQVSNVSSSDILSLPQQQNITMQRFSGLHSMKALDAIAAQPPAPARWALPGLLPEGVILLAGKPKMGKSWLALDLGLAVAAGATALGTFPAEQEHVLYLGLEDNERRIYERTQKMLPGQKLPGAFIWAGVWAPLIEGGLEDLQSFLHTYTSTRLIIIDTLVRVRSMRTANSSIYGEDYATITPLKHLAEQYNISIMLVHHLRKSGAADVMDEISGTTGLTGATDCNMVLRRERGQNAATLAITGRDVEEQSLSLLFHEPTGRWSMVTPTSTKRKLSPERQAIVDLLQQEGPTLTAPEISQHLHKSANATANLLHEMEKQGILFKPSRGYYALSTPEQQEV